MMNDFYNKINKGAILTSGSIDNYNAMTIGWATIGCLWSKKVLIVYVKPCRYTNSFMEKNEYFTVSFYTNEYKKELAYFGTKSGRDVDKAKECNMHPISLDKYQAVTFKEATETIICKKIYSQTLTEPFLDEVRDKYYKTEEPHIVYVGEIIE